MGSLLHNLSIRRQLVRNVLRYAVHVMLRHEWKGGGIIQPKYGPHVPSKVDTIVFVAGWRLLAQQCRNTILADVAIADGL